MPSGRTIIIELLIMVAISLVLAAIGPFGTFEMGDFPVRLAYWLPVTLLAFAIFRPISWLADRIGQLLGTPHLFSLALSGLVATFPATLLVLWWGGYRLDSLPAFSVLFEGYVRVALIGGVITLFFYLFERRAPGAAQAAVAPTTAPIPFLDRLPPSWNAQLVALEMEDHYVRAHGPDGVSSLILMRMADAERELAAADGARVHRSWWVMREAVTGTKRDKRAIRLDLGGGLVAPVARDRLAALRRDGWPI